VHILLRHGQAGSKHSWVGDDQIRPLDGRGRAQARGLVTELLPYAPSRIISSTYLRCTQTVAPLATALDLAIEPSEHLVPDGGGRAARLLHDLAEADAGAVVLCTHGEVIGDLQTQLERRGPLFGPRRAREKGSVWVLEASGPTVARATYLPPPA
jgi:phosphohistidine phosphatase SixA